MRWLFLIPVFIAAAAGATPPAAELQRCRAIPDPGARLACYDTAVDRDVRQAQQPPLTGEELFGKPASVVAETIAGAAKVQVPDTLTASVTAIARAGDLRIFLTLDNGQRWRQVDTTPFDVHIGDRVTIRAAALGSFLLTGERGNRAIRISRVD